MKDEQAQNTNKEEIRLVDKVMEKLAAVVNYKTVWKTGKGKLDGTLSLKYNQHKLKLNAVVKKTIGLHQMDRLIADAEQMKPAIVLAEYILPKVKERLREREIAYAETNGNVFIKNKDLLIWVDGQKAEEKKEMIGRAFAKTGVRLIYQLLIDRQLVNQTYREIAALTGVSFGNINTILNDLKQQNYLVPVTKNTWTLVNTGELIEKWAGAYRQKLWPVIFTGRYRFATQQDQLHWKNMTINPDKTVWGGEPAGDLLTNYLNPEIFTLYTTQTRQDLLKDYRLIPDKEGNIQTLEKFWKIPAEHGNTVHPLLAYVDLINTGDRRCLETAQKIKNEYLQDQF